MKRRKLIELNNECEVKERKSLPNDRYDDDNAEMKKVYLENQ